MTGESNPSPVAALLALALVLVLLVGGAAFYFVTERQRATSVARQVEAEARAHQAIAQEREAKARADLAAAAVPPTAGNSDAIRTAVESVLRTQQNAWNRGDVDAFVEHYWRSPDVTFSSGGATTRGWDATARRYRERYPTREKMGELSFDNLEITPLGADAALVLGQWRLQRDAEPVSGNFSLIFRKLDSRWVIVHDHTSKLSP